MKKITILIIVLIVVIALIIGAIYYLIQPKEKKTEQPVGVIDADTTIEGDYELIPGEKLVIKNGAKVTINGNLKNDGEIECENGSLNLIVNGNAEINDKLTCENPTEESDNDINMVVADSLTLNENATITTDGSLQIVEKEEDLATTQQEIDQKFEEAAADTCDGNCLGPLIGPEETSSGPESDEKTDEDSGRPVGVAGGGLSAAGLKAAA